MRRPLALLRIGLLVLIGTILVLYAGDYLFVRYRMTQKKTGDPFEDLTIKPMYGIPHKNGSAEIVFGDPEVETCVHSLFPHLGYAPCWYLNRSSKKIIMLELLVTRPSVGDSEN